MPDITMDTSYSPELVEFWAARYRSLKHEMEQVQESHKTQLETEKRAMDEERTEMREFLKTFQRESIQRTLFDKELQASIQLTRREETILREKLTTLEQQNSQLIINLGRSESDRAILTHQMQVVYTQAASLATEVDQYRRVRISQLFPPAPTPFVDASFEPKYFPAVNPQEVINALPETLVSKNNLYFLHCPPRCMPLRLPCYGQSGYWFSPPWNLLEGQSIELVVEGKPNQWSYLGCYASAPLLGWEMTLAEWFTLDEQTKAGFCYRIASRDLPPGQTASYPAQLDVKRRYDMAQWSVPCYSLRCLGFNMPLSVALHRATDTTSQSNPTEHAASISGTSGKRCRTVNVKEDDKSLSEEQSAKKARQEILRIKQVLSEANLKGKQNKESQ